jgi:hypothetical protein
MIFVEAPNEIYSIEASSSKKLFLAGGITNCPDWQSPLIVELRKLNLKDLIVYNPRRANFPMHDPNAAEEQITWEYEHLKSCDYYVFWFAKGSLNPIVLYELGMYGNSSKKPMCICIDNEYERSQDVVIQTKLARKDVPIFSFSSEKNIQMVANWVSIIFSKT